MPHDPAHDTIWQTVLHAKLFIFIYPMYVMRVPGQLKALLDYWGVHWISRCPAPERFTKKALVVTQGVGAPTGGVRGDEVNALQWMGLPLQQDLLRKQTDLLSTDTRYWLDQGWIRP